ncbi:hypothetical protein [Streptomyces sp. NPDC020607]|uniref:hypothetical protein n=1 Tax=Streptomyces sp. NPDC020607 TaxID=3365082 RepID=UPI0037A8B630
MGLVLTAAAFVPSGAAGAAAADAYEWVALGVSYNADGYVGEPLPALGDASRDGCARTTEAYPALVDRELAEFPPGLPVHLTDRCSRPKAAGPRWTGGGGEHRREAAH